MAEEFGEAFGGVFCGFEFGVKGGVFGLELFDEALALGFVRCGGNSCVPRGEELLLLQFYALPRWVAEDDIEAAAGENIREFQRPVEETMFPRKRADVSQQVARNGGGAFKIVAQGLSCRDSVGVMLCELCEESGGPDVAGGAVTRRFALQFLQHLLLLTDDFRESSGRWSKRAVWAARDARLCLGSN